MTSTANPRRRLHSQPRTGSPGVVRRLATAAFAVAVGVGAALTAVGATAPPAAAAGPALPAVYPAPQSMEAYGGPLPLGTSVAVLTGPGSDAPAVSALRKALTDNGVTRIDEISAPGDAADHETVVYVGGPGENPSTTDALAALDVTGAGDLSAQGYVLATGEMTGHPTIVLDGHDTDGTFYAVQTLRQLITPGAGGATVPGVRVRDWPTMPLRGVIEGFYGPEYSDADRTSMFDFEAENKMNIFVYSPKDDPYLRAEWRDQYPAAQLAAIQQLAQRATADHVEFTYALSPGLSVCYSSASDEATLVAKLESIYAIGVRSFSIPLDDITEGSFNCAADTAKFGTGNAAAGAAQAYLLNEVQNDFIAAHPDVKPLQMVPTEYTGESDSAYKTALRQNLDPAIIVGWTGDGVVPATITTQQAAAAKQVYGHPVLLWDNYPVNDYVTNRLLLGPYVGRETGLSAHLYGVTANPMVQSEPSKIALFGVAAYTWNDAAYDAKKAWAAGIDQLAGPDPQARQALAALADLSYSSNLDATQAPTLTAKIDDFWTAWERGMPGADADLDAYLKVIESIPTTLPATIADPEFATQAQTWLKAAGDWGTAAREALKMLTDERAGRIAAAVADRVAAESDRAKAAPSALDSAPIDAFISKALAENGRFLGVSATDQTGPHAITSLPTYQSYTPDKMVDGNPDTFYWSSAAPSAGSYVGVDLGGVVPVTGVSISAGDAASPGDYIFHAALEYSTDGSTWHTVGTYENQPNISATLPAGTSARYVRLRATASDGNWVKVHEFHVDAQYPTLGNVSGTPAPAAGSTLAAAGDGALTTAYTAAGAPADGDALVLTLPEAKALAQVEVIGTGEASVQIKVGDSWRTIGALSSGGYTELPASDATASAIRLAWVSGSPAPTITDIVPRYAADESLAVTASASATDLVAGGTAQLSAEITSTLTRPVRGLLTVKAPAGLTVKPEATPIPVFRGGQTATTIELTADKAGSYPVTLTYAPAGFAPVSTTVTITVHPQVSTTNVALAANGATVTASGTEQDLPQFQPKYAIDGDTTTRWSSPYDDAAWLQVHFASPQTLGKVVIRWESAYGKAFDIQTSSNGTDWTTAAAITNGTGGTQTIWIDQSGVTDLRFQGVTRATSWGYSFYELEAYPVAGS